MAYHRDLRDHLRALEEHGKLVRVDIPVNKDTQLHPIVRLQFRGLPEEERKAFLFTNVIDSRGRKYGIPVAVCALAGSLDIYAIGMMCKPEEIAEKAANAELHPIAPRIVASGPVHEEVHAGDRLLEHGGLDEFPVPISTPGYDVAPFLTASNWVTRDPDTGVRNVGVYRCQLKAPDRLGVHFGDVSRGGIQHWYKYKALGVPMPCAIVLGGPPSVSYVGVSKLPAGVDELTVAGGIAGEPLELVRCKTVDLEVPAYAEIVVEGLLSTDELEVEAPFGEAVGYIGMTEKMPYLKVTAITHRKDPVFLSFISQMPPSESSKIRQPANEGLMLKHLKYELKMSHVTQVSFHESSGAHVFAVIRMKKTDQAEVWRTLEAAGKRFITAKIIVAVDDDIDPRDIDNVNWAICSRFQPHRDCRTVTYRTSFLNDLSLESSPDLLKRRYAQHDAKMERPEASRLLVNATLKWPYPPVSLPRKEFMLDALRVWQQLGLTPLKLKEPWSGYDLGYWGEEYDEWARMAVNGEYYKTGDIRSRNRIRIDDKSGPA